MVVDLRNCFGCKSCAVACSEANGVPPGSWRQVLDNGVDEAPSRQRMCLPISCNHCGEPPCLDVCPTGATYRRSDGVVDIDPERCLGCGYCVAACPYRARIILDRNSNPENITSEDGNKGRASSETGVCTKCNFCLSRIERGLERGLTPGVDAEATPTCVFTCSARALHFGDLEDPESDVSRLLRENRTVRLQESLGTDAAVYYIAPPRWTEPANPKEEG
jgi:phenylacetyl-CoA:acceptor oxidoreductase subunit 1